MSARRRKILAGILIVGLALWIGAKHWIAAHDWAMIKRSTHLRAAETVADLVMYEDPSFIHPCWIFASFSIPRANVERFVTANGCESTDRTTLRFQRPSIPLELQSLPTTGQRFYKCGTTTSELGFDLLVDSEGRVRMFVLTPD